MRSNVAQSVIAPYHNHAQPHGILAKLKRA